MTYRRRYFAPALPAPVLDLLLLDDTNPRSAAFQLKRIQEHLEVLAKLPGHEVTGVKRRLISGIIASLRGLDLERRADSGDAGFLHLAGITDNAARQLHTLSDFITQTYFAHTDSRVR